MDVGATVDRVEPVLDEVIPALPAEQGADLRQTKIIVGVAEREAADLGPAVKDGVKRIADPEQQHDDAPMTHAPRVHLVEQPTHPLQISGPA